MSTLFSDTSPASEHVQLELLRRAPARRKLHMVAQMNLTVRRLALSGSRGKPTNTRFGYMRRKAFPIPTNRLGSRTFRSLSATARPR